MELYQLHYFVEVARNRNFTHSAPEGHPEVFEVAVVGVPHEKLGETAKAFVVLKKDSHVKGRQLIAYCSEHLARFKCPRRIEFVDALPRNATGKIHKPTLRKNFSAPKPTDKAAIAS